MSERANALVLKFRADTSAAQNAITSMAKTGASQMAILAAGAAAAGRTIDSSLLSTLFKLATAITGLQAAYAGFGIVAAASLAIAIERMQEYRKVADDAAKAGLSTDFFQKFTQALGTTKEKVDALKLALRQAREATAERLDGSAFGNRLGEFNTNSGTLGAQLAAFRAAQTTEERIRAAAAAVDELLARGDRLVALDLAEKLFGAQAAQDLIARADASGRSLGQMVEALDGKNIISPEQIENAKELERRLEAARSKMADGLKPIMADLEVLGQALYRGWVSTEEAIANATAAVGRFYKILKDSVLLLPSFQGLPGSVQQATATAELQNVERQLDGIRRSGVFDPRQRGLEQQREALRGRIYQQQGRDMLAADAVPAIDMPASGPVELGPNDPTARMARELLAERQRRRYTGGAGTTAPSAGGGGGAASEADAYAKLVAQIEKATAALQAEYQTLGLNRFERERAILLAKAEAELKEKGRELTASERADLEAKIEVQARYKMLIEDTKTAMEKSKELQNFIGTSVSGFLSDIASGGRNAADSIMNITKRLIDMGAQAALLGQGPLAGLFGLTGSNGNVGGIIGALFGGFRAGGGDVSSNKAYIIGERGPELFVPRASGTVVPNGRISASGAPGTLTVRLEVSPDLEGRILSKTAAQNVRVVQSIVRNNNQKIPGMLAEQGAR